MDTKKVTLEGLVSGDALDLAYKKRNVKYVYKKVVKQDLQPFVDEGWERTGYRSKKYFRLRKLKDVGPGFEDEVWCIFKKMGFNEMSKDNNFVIHRHRTNLTKQIDVFAKDEQVICIVECKAAKNPHTKRSLDKNIDQLAAIRHEIELSIFDYYLDPGNRKKLKIVWILATKNIDISENDRERAKQARIRILDDITYYSELSNHFGKSSKYQFLADMFPGRDIPELIEPIPAVKGTMGDRVFYSFVMEPAKLLKMAYIAHRGKSNEETMKTYQRIAKKSRLKKIAEYIHEKEGIFPTSIVLNIQTSGSLRFDQAGGMGGKNAVLGTLYLPNKYKSAWIIDGQHRLFAYSDLEEAETATLPVIAFENLDPEIQANLFIDINGEQVKVPKSLLVDLWATLHWSSENPSERLKALTSRLVKVLNEHPQSPFRDRIINIGGRKTKTRNLTLNALADEIRRRQLLGSVSSRRAKVITPGPLFLDDLDTTLIRAREVISGYFNKYIDKNGNLKRQWEIGSGDGGYICTNGGIIALIRVLKTILDHLANVENMDINKMKTSELLDNIWKYQKPICEYLGSVSTKILQDFRRQYGEGGYTACTNALLWEINKIYNYFDPPGLQQWIQSQNVDNPRAYSIICDIEKGIMGHITAKLKEEFGEDISQWWHNGVPENIRVPTTKRANEDGDYRYPEKYVELIDWKDIISHNFNLFGDTFTIDAKPTESKKKRLSWLVKVNEIRRIVAHASRGGVSDSDLEYLSSINDKLTQKLGQGVDQVDQSG